MQTVGLREFYISQGFAWAASSYSRNGYVIDEAIEETDALRSEFNSLTGQDTPTGTIITGFSMGRAHHRCRDRASSGRLRRRDADVWRAR